jgi:hypothetical protein
MRGLIILSLMICAVILSGCSGGMTDQEARDILAELVPRSQELNEVFWGDAIKTANDDAVPLSTVTTAQYYPVADDSPYRSVGDIKAAAEKVFSADYLSSVYTMLFTGTDDVEPRYKDDEDGHLVSDITFEPYDLNTEIFPETAVIKETGAGIVRVEVECITAGKPGRMNIMLREQDGVWLIDSPTY